MSFLTSFRTGRYWVDGKKVYQKTVYIEGFVNNGIRTCPHDIEQLQQIVDIAGIWGQANNQYQSLPRVSAGTSIVALTATNEIVSVKTYISEAAYAQAKAWVTLQYTCTDR